MSSKYLAIVFALVTSSSSAQVLIAENLFDPQHLLKIEIELADEDWDTLRLQSRTFLTALQKHGPPESPFTYVKGNITIDGVLIEDVGIRKKGFLGSLDEQRPSLKVKFTEYKDQAPIVGLDRLTLNNNKQDPAGLSHLLAYEFFNQSGSVASRCNLAHVTVNGKDLGVYSNVEPIKRQFLERAFGDGSGALFEGTVVDFYDDFIDRFEEKNEQADRAVLRDVAELLAKDEVDLDELGKLIDLDAFVLYWATESLLGYWDGYTNDQNNFFIYQNPANSKLYFLPWGADHAFAESMPIPPYKISPQFVYTRSLLANRLYRIPQIRDAYHDTLERLLADHWNEAELVAEIERIKTQNRDLAGKNVAAFDNSVRSTRNFVQSRRQKLTREMADPFELTTEPKRPAYAKKIGSFKATFDAKWYDASPKEGKSVGTADIDMQLNGEQFEFKELGVYAEHSKWPPLPADVPKPPALIFRATRASDGQDFTVGVGLPIEKFRATQDDSVEIGGLLIQGKFGSPSATYKFLSGSATFDEAAMEDGAPVSGTLNLTVLDLVDSAASGSQK